MAGAEAPGTEGECAVSDFGWAAAELRRGKCVQRKPWARKGIWLSLAEPDARVTLPFICVRRSSGDVAPWQACHSDLLASDWMTAVAEPA